MGEAGKRIGAVCCQTSTSDVYKRRELTFDEILLDETLVEGNIWVRKSVLKEVGGVNYRLSSKRRYELILRVAQCHTVMTVTSKGEEKFYEAEVKPEDAWICVDDADECGDATDMRTDCYLIGRYKQRLLELGYFDDAVLSVLQVGGTDVTQYLEEMLGRNTAYYNLYDATQPILIYKGTDLCYSVLDAFAKYLGDALAEYGQTIEYFDMTKQKMEDIVCYTKRRFKAVIGIQTYMFSVQKKDGSLVHDMIDAPMYHFIFDHPIWLRNHLTRVPRRLCVLTPDGNYARFAESYYGHKARFFPPAGCKETHHVNERDFELSFLGSYGEGPLNHLRILRNADKEKCYLANRYILYMRKHLACTPEQALGAVLEEYGISCSKEEFVNKMYELRWAVLGLANHYRNKVISILLKAGLTLHVFGDSWKKSRMWGHPGLVCHEAAIGEAALEVYARSKISLNIMTWHKDGFTERIANAMLQKSVVVTDRTTYLEQNFIDGQDMVLFDLAQIEGLPDRIKELLSDKKMQTQMVEKAYRKAAEKHTWMKRAEELLQLIEEDRL